MNKRQEIADKVVLILLEGKHVYREDINCLGEDANYVIDYIRNIKLIPIECNRGVSGAEPFWYMSNYNIKMYRSHRDEPRSRQKNFVTQGQRKRQITIAEQLFHNLEIPIPQKFQDIIKNTFARGSHDNL